MKGKHSKFVACDDVRGSFIHDKAVSADFVGELFGNLEIPY
jgi:hypothetical protein